MIRKPVIITAAVLILISAAVFIYRYQILQYTAEALIRKYLPAYVRIDTIRFDFVKGDISLGGFKIANPAGFSDQYLASVEKITCHYKMGGKTILDGLELSGPVLTGAVLNIERLGDGRVNLAEAEALAGKGPLPPPAGPAEGKRSPQNRQAPENRKAAGPVRIPEKFIIKNARAVFMDRRIRAAPVIITFDNVNAELALKMDGSRAKLLGVNSAGEGNLNGDRNQAVKWVNRTFIENDF